LTIKISLILQKIKIITPLGNNHFNGGCGGGDDNTVNSQLSGIMIGIRHKYKRVDKSKYLV
jgi:hypothetical protein